MSMLGWERRFRSNLRAVGSRGGFTIWGPAHVFKRPLCHEGTFVDVRGVPQGSWLGLVWAGKARRASYMAAWPATGPGRGSSGRWGARGEPPSRCVHALGPCCWLTTFMTRVAFVGGRGARLLLDRRRSRAWCRRSHAPPLRPVAGRARLLHDTWRRPGEPGAHAPKPEPPYPACLAGVKGLGAQVRRGAAGGAIRDRGARRLAGKGFSTVAVDSGPARPRPGCAPSRGPERAQVWRPD